MMGGSTEKTVVVTATPQPVMVATAQPPLLAVATADPVVVTAQPVQYPQHYPAPVVVTTTTTS